MAKPTALTGPIATASRPEATNSAKTTPAMRSTVSSMGSSVLSGCTETEAPTESPTSASCAVERKALSVRRET